MSEYTRLNCFCCNRIVDSEMPENPMVIGIAYRALLFRATGNYGSSVFDPPHECPEILQIVICDDCLKKKAKRVTRLYNIEHEATAECGEFIP